MRHAIVAGLTGFAMVLSIAALAQGKKELRYATSAPPNTPWEKQINEFRDDIAKNSKGALELVPYLNSALGNEQEAIQQVQRGRIDAGGFSVTAGALIVPETALLATPFIWDSEKQLDCVLDNHVLGVFQELFAKKGVFFLGWAETGWVVVVGKKPLVTPNDTKGYKVRVAPSKASAMFWAAVGANGVPLGVTDINPSLQTGLVDGADLPITFYVGAGIGRLAPQVVATRHIHLASVTLFNKRTFDGLPKEQQKAIVDLATDPAKLRREIRGMENFLLAKHKEAGGSITEISKEQRDQWRERVTPIYPDLVKESGPDAPRVWDLIQKGKAACPAA